MPKELEYEENAYVGDSVRTLIADTYSRLSEDKMTIVKAYDRPKTTMTHHSGKKVLVEREYDSQLFLVSANLLAKNDIDLYKGNVFTVRVIIPDMVNPKFIVEDK